MKNYKNIDKIETLDDGTMSVFMKNGKRAIIEIVKLNEKFEAAIYGKFAEETTGVNHKKETGLLAKLEHFDAYKDCAKEAVGWIDENPLDFTGREEIKMKR